jgi:DNA modification methylase
MFPAALVERLIRCFTREGSRRVLDPFCGSGSTLLAALAQGGEGAGFEVSPEYLELARKRLCARESPSSGTSDQSDVSHSSDDVLGPNTKSWQLFPYSADEIPHRLPARSVDLCVTSPPYWNILARRRTADMKAVRDYAVADGDLSRVTDYEEFVERLGTIFHGIYDVLKPGAYCIINVMDLRQKSRFYPLHADLSRRLDREHGGKFIFDDLIIWDRRADYNNLRPLGYPAVFRINKVHEYLLIFQRPQEEKRAQP